MPKSQFKVLHVEHITDATFILRLERRDFVFKAGQCVNLGKVGHGVNREYSIYSGEADPYLEFVIRKVDNGIVSRSLQALVAGDAVEVDGPYGQFCLEMPMQLGTHFVFVATGTGIAPFASFIRTYLKLDYQVLHGVRYLQECNQYKHGDAKRYIGCISQDKNHTSNDVFHGRVTDYLKQHPLDTSATYYLCGNRNMINDVYDFLRLNNINGTRIFTEVFF